MNFFSIILFPFCKPFEIVADNGSITTVNLTHTKSLILHLMNLDQASMPLFDIIVNLDQQIDSPQFPRYQAWLSLMVAC